LVPLLAVAVILGVSGIHGRRTHDPDRAMQALDVLAETEDARVAKAELDSFLQSGWVGWDVKTAVEIACGTIHARNIADPVLCVTRSRNIVFGHLLREQVAYRNYTLLAWSALAPALAFCVLGALLLARSRARPRPPAPDRVA
jgi:hypothetical protein